MSADAAPPLGQRPAEPMPGKDSLANPKGPTGADGDQGTCPDCGLPYGEHPEYHAHGGERDRATGEHGMDLPGQRLDNAELGGDQAEA